MTALPAARLEMAVAAWRAISPLNEPADNLLSRFFRAHPQAGLHDRGFIADTVFGLLRHRFLVDSSGAATPRRLILAYLLKFTGLSLRELEPCLSREEAKWLAQLKQAALADLPFHVRAELPQWLIEKLEDQLSRDEILALGRGMQNPAPLDLRVNTVRASREEVLHALLAEGLQAESTPYSPIGVRLNDKISLSRHPLFMAGKIEVQDEGSQLLCFLLAPRRNEMVVDFCAGSGGKALALGALMSSQGRVYAFDVSDRRLINLKPRLKRSGLSNLHPQRLDSENDTKLKRLAGKIDRVLVDAPCSGLGTLRRNPDLKFRQSPHSIEELKQKQFSILQHAAKLLKPGGRLVYATCSILQEENQQIVSKFLLGNNQFALANSSGILAQHAIPLDTGEYFQLAPHTHGTDGFFAAVMEKING
ncbi:MAG: RsmB/NOP family class I SAM-dependent RNA methyltransferase [Burkholderiales bacterium]